MTGYSERIKPTDFSIRSYLEDLTHQRYQIPTFQRDVVWTPDSVKKLWIVSTASIPLAAS